MEKQIEGFSKYSFSNCGKVYALYKKGKKEIIGSKDKDGYLKISLVNDFSKCIYYRKHRLIAWAFLGYSNMQVNHKDGNILNNHIDNLEYVTIMENQCHRRKMEGFDIGVCWAKKEKNRLTPLQNSIY